MLGGGCSAWPSPSPQWACSVKLWLMGGVSGLASHLGGETEAEKKPPHQWDPAWHGQAGDSTRGVLEITVPQPCGLSELLPARRAALLSDSAFSLLPAPSCLPAPALSCLLSPACPLLGAARSISSLQDRGLGGSLPRRAPRPRSPGSPQPLRPTVISPSTCARAPPPPPPGFAGVSTISQPLLWQRWGGGGWRSPRPALPTCGLGQPRQGLSARTAPPGPCQRRDLPLGSSPYPRLSVSPDGQTDTRPMPGWGKVPCPSCWPWGWLGVQGLPGAWVLPRAAPALLPSGTKPCDRHPRYLWGRMGSGWVQHRIRGCEEGWMQDGCRIEAGLDAGWVQDGCGAG